VRTEKGVIEMNRKIPFLVTTLALLIMLLTSVAPAMASQPKTTYTFGEIDFPDPAHLGTQFYSAPNLLHTRDSGALNYMFGAPWGSSLTPGHVTSNVNVDLRNMEAVTGTGLAHFVDSYPTGTMVGTTSFKIVGAGALFYNGPDIIVNSETLYTAGDLLIGSIFEGTVVGHGEGGLDGIHWSGDYMGVGLIDGTGMPTGINVIWGQATYMVTGAGK
jgi:hypothetical protein